MGLTLEECVGSLIVGLSGVALLLLFYAVRPTNGASGGDPSWESRLHLLKLIRVVSFSLLAVGQASIAAWRASRGTFSWGLYDAQLVITGVLWATAAVGGVGVCRVTRHACGRRGVVNLCGYMRQQS